MSRSQYGAGRALQAGVFQGQARTLQISQGEHYSADFEPEFSFASDAADDPHWATLIYDGSKVEGELVIDLSGCGNDCMWVMESR